MYMLGIDIGTSSVKVAAMAADGTLVHTGCATHQGAPLACLRNLLDRLSARCALQDCSGVAATGSGAGLLGDQGLNVSILGAVPAIVQGARALAPHAASVMELGGQSARFVTDIGSGTVPQFSANESCAAGTGSFFEDQMERLGLQIGDYSRLVEGARSVPRLSGRCSVFAKTDIIHRQQEGVSSEDILLGLCYAMVKSYKASIVRGLPVQPPVVLAGGVLRNSGVVRAVREVFNLGEEGLLVSEDYLYLQAAGAAASLLEATAVPGAATAYATLTEVRAALDDQVAGDDLPRLAPLPQISYEPGAGYELHSGAGQQGAGGPLPCALGVDVGSTSVDVVLLDLDGKLVDAQYLRTGGDPQRAVAEGLRSVDERLGADIRVCAAGVTGSGRGIIAQQIGADCVHDEITAQARAAVAADPTVDTVFEIGGQDSKYISCSGGQVVDFQMNKVCAAGTGSFVEEQAGRLGIDLPDFGPLALSAARPVDLGERCTVFVETAINAALSKGAPLGDVAAGLCLSIVRNYLHKVVGSKPVGSKVVLQGGVAFNPGIVAAFRALCGDEVTISPWFAVSGAVGAGLMALEAHAASPGCFFTSFRGLDLSGEGFSGARIDPGQVKANRAFYRRSEELFLEGMDSAIDPAKKTVGVPRALLMHKLFPLANAFFHHLGYNVALSDESDEEIVALSQGATLGEVCYPVKLMCGHMEQLARRGVDYLFMPSVHTIRHAPSETGGNYACTYMQTAPRFVADSLHLHDRGVELISPLLRMDFGQAAMADAMLGVGEQLGHTRAQAARALLAGSFAVSEFTRKTEELGAELLASLSPRERVLVLITRNYGIADPALNMGIPDALLDRGQKVITLSHLQAHDVDISEDYPGVCWPFGQHIIAGARIVRNDPRLYAVYLTNHACGPDTMLSHLFAEEMGDKPYLQIETDEHASQVGVITRIEAFLNALDHYDAQGAGKTRAAARPAQPAEEAARAGMVCALPAMGAYGQLAAAWLTRRGHEVRLMRQTEDTLRYGQREATSKEYYSFTSLLGRCLKAAEEAKRPAAPDGPQLQLWVPATEGSEADGLYGRVVRSVLDKRGYGEVRVAAPALEELPWTVKDPEGLFLALLAGDIAYAAAPGRRDALIDELCSDELSFDALCRAAQGLARRAPDRGKVLALVGEWPCVYDEDMVGGLWQGVEDQGYRVRRMPFAEYLWFLWSDAMRTNDARAKGAPVSSPAYPAQKKTDLLNAFARQMKQVHALLGASSPYCGDPGRLQTAATASIGALRGGNARYRHAKMLWASRRADGVICAASLYENADAVLRLESSRCEEGSGRRTGAPVLHLSFDGALDGGIQDKLQSFLYYV